MKVSSRRLRNRFLLAPALAVALVSLAAPLGVANAGELRNLRLSAEGLPESDVVRPGDPAPHLDWAGVQISSDGEWIVYRHDDRVDETFELYAVRRDGSDRVRLSPDLAPGEVIDGFAITPDGKTVIFRGGASAPKRFGLYRVPIAGPSSAAVALYLPEAGRTVDWMMEISADSRVVVFRVTDSAGVVDPAILIARLDENAPAPRVVHPTPAWTAPATAIYLTPDSTRVLLRAGGLLSMPVDGTPADWVRLDEGEATGAWELSRVLFTPNSERAIIIKSVSDDQLSEEAFGVPVAGPGSAAVRLNPPLQDGSGRVNYAHPTPDSSRVLLRVRKSYRYDIWTVPITGPASAATQVSVPATGLNGAGIPEVTPDSSEVVYSMTTNLAAPSAYRVPVDGPAEESVVVTPPLAQGAPFAWKRLTPDGRFLLYAVDATETGGAKQAYAVPFATAPNGWFPTGGEFTDGLALSWFLIEPSSRWVVLVADFESPERYEIFRAFLDEPERPAERVNRVLPPGGFVRNDMALTPDGYGVVYRADSETPGKVDLWIADGLVFRDGFESGDAGHWNGEVESPLSVSGTATETR